MTWVGARGFWIEDNAYCEIIGVIDEGAGVYEFTYVPPIPEDDDHDFFTWVGLLNDFFPEDSEC